MSGLENKSLPKGWSLTRLGDLVDRLQYGYTAKADSNKPGVRFLRITDIEKGKIDWSQVPGCDVSMDELERYRLHDGDIVFARTGSIEKTCMVRMPPDAVFASYLIRGRPLVRDVSAWLNAFVGSYLYVNQAMAASAGIGRLNVNAVSLSEIEIPIAPLPEQRRIVAAIEDHFSRLDEAVALLERVQRNLKRYRASVLKAAVEGRLVPTEAETARAEGRSYEPASVLLERILDERRRRWKSLGAKGPYKEPAAPDTTNLPSLPEGWCWASVEQIGTTVTGTTPSTSRKTYYGGDIPFVKPTDLDVGYHVVSARQTLSDEGVLQARILPANSVLVTCIGATIGKTGFSRTACVTNQQINALVPDRLTVPDYFYWFFAGPTGLSQVKNNASSTTLPILNKSRFERIVVPLPPKDEQRRIVADIERYLSIEDELGREAEHNLARCLRLRQSILKWAFEGRLVDQDPTDEPASVLLERIRSERSANAAAKPRGRGNQTSAQRGTR